MSPEDIPRYVRYDFFIAVLGIVIVYFAFSNSHVYDNSALRWGSFIFGVAISVYGMTEMSSTYYAEKKIQRAKAIIDLVNVKNQLNNIPKNQREREDISVWQFVEKHRMALIIALIVIASIVLIYLYLQ